LSSLQSDFFSNLLGGSSVAAASMLVRASLSRRSDPMGAKDAPDLFPTKLDPLLFLELLGQMTIVESPVLPIR
jgi:hypothetical protein